MADLSTQTPSVISTTFRFVMLNLAFATIYFSPGFDHGGQTPLLFLFLLSLPLLFFKRSYQGLDLSFVAPFVVMFLVAIPLAIKSGEGEALDVPSRFLIMAAVLIGLSRFHFDGKWLLRSAMLSCLVAAAICLIEIQEFNPKRVSLGIGTLESGYTLAIMLFACSTSLLLEQSKTCKTLAGLAIILCLITLLMTGTRGAWFATVLTLVPFGVMFSPRIKIHVLLLSFIFLITICGVGYSMSDTAQKRVNATIKELKLIGNFQKKTSSNIRLIFWEHAWEGFQQSPLTGISYQENAALRQVFAEKYSTPLPGTEDGRGSSHNEILNAMVQKGLLGLAAVLLIYLIPLRFFFKYRKSDNDTIKAYAALGICTVSVMAVSGLTEAPLMHGSVSVTYGMMLILLYHAIRHTEQPR